MFRPLERLINLEDGYRRAFKLDHLELLLIQEGGERYLVERRCPHRGQLLDGARLADGCLQCPLHQLRFDLSSGRVDAAMGMETRDLRVYELVYEGNEVGLWLGEASG